jgi:hypothetical protein
MSTLDHMGLGRRTPQDDEHIQKYSLTMETVPAVATPVVLGINWYEDFYTPEKDSRGRYWIGKDSRNLGKLRGGHCVVIKPSSLSDPLSWWDYYDQGSEGACVGFGSSRAMSLIERKRFDAHWLYREAQMVDGWSDTPPEEGTSVRAAFDILRSRGHVRVVRGKTTLTPDMKYGVLRNRWARTVDEIVACLAAPKLYDIGGVPILNSWGRHYPHIVYMPLETLQRMLNEHGEATLWTPN